MNDTTTLESIIVKSGSLNHWEILFVVTLSILIAIANTLMGCEVSCFLWLLEKMMRCKNIENRGFQKSFQSNFDRIMF